MAGAVAFTPPLETAADVAVVAEAVPRVEVVNGDAEAEVGLAVAAPRADVVVTEAAGGVETPRGLAPRRPLHGGPLPAAVAGAVPPPPSPRPRLLLHTAIGEEDARLAVPHAAPVRVEPPPLGEDALVSHDGVADAAEVAARGAETRGA